MTRQRRSTKGSGSVVWDEATSSWLAIADITHLNPEAGRKRLKRSGKTKAEAQTRLTGALAALERKREEESSATITLILDEWLAYEIHGKYDDQTVYGHERSITILKEHLGDILVRNLTVDDVEKALRDIGGAKDTLQRHRNRLKKAIYWARKRTRFGLGPGFPNVCEDVSIPAGKPKKPKSRQWLEPEQMDAVEQALLEVPEYPLLLTIAKLGLRPAEGTGLRTIDVNVDDGLVHVRQSMKYGKNKAPIRFGDVKTGAMGRGVRTIRPSSELMLLLEAQLVKVRQDREHMGWPAKWELLLFPTANGTPYLLDNLRRTLRRAAKQAGLDNLTTYDLRRAAAKRAIERMDIAEVADLLGHEDTRMAREVYTGRRTRPITFD